MKTSMESTMCVLLLLLLKFVSFSYGRSVVDLTHTFDKDAPKWPLQGIGVQIDTYFNMTTLFEGYVGDMWGTIRKVEFYEHLGTHIDAPIHMAAGRQTVDEIPPNRLIGPGVVIDVREKAKLDPGYSVTVADIEDYETEYGRIPSDAIVLMNSGWAKYYPNPEFTFGTKTVNDTSTFRFPGFSYEACKMLLRDRQVGVVGVDTPSVDPGQDPAFYCHVHLQNSNVPLLEYVANLDSIPPRGTTIVLGAIKTRHGSGGPTRIFALLDENDEDWETNQATTHTTHSLVSAFVCVLFYSVVVLTA